MTSCNLSVMQAYRVVMTWTVTAQSANDALTGVRMGGQDRVEVDALDERDYPIPGDEELAPWAVEIVRREAWEPPSRRPKEMSWDELVGWR